MYGQELILDLENCDVSKFEREHIEAYLIDLCKRIDMHREDLHWWDYDPDKREGMAEHLAGVTACQFISTSNIVIHTLDKKKLVLINIFSCKEIDKSIAKEVTLEYFGGNIINCLKIERG